MNTVTTIYREARGYVREFGLLSTLIGMSGGIALMYADWTEDHIRAKRDRKQGQMP